MVKMERIVNIPEGVNIEVNGFKVSVSGQKAKLERDFYSPLFQNEIIIKKAENKISISTESKKRKIKSMVGSIESHIKNMIMGVTEGYICKMKIVSIHFPITVKVSGNEVVIQNFIGEKSPRKAKVMGDTKIDVKEDEITLTGNDKEEVGQSAANIESATKIKARDRRVFQDSIVITKKP